MDERGHRRAARLKTSKRTPRRGERIPSEAGCRTRITALDRGTRCRHRSFRLATASPLLQRCVAALAASAIFTSTSSQAATAAQPRRPRPRHAGPPRWSSGWTRRATWTAGSTYYKLGFTNLSRRACHLLGYPGVSAVGLGGRRLGSPASRDHSRRPRLVTLARGATATAVREHHRLSNSSRPVTAAGFVSSPERDRAEAGPLPIPRLLALAPVHPT